MLVSSLASALVVIFTSALVGKAAVVTGRAALDELSVEFYDDVNFSGDIYAPSSLEVGTCYGLPDDWHSRPASLRISSGYICAFYTHSEDGPCSGSGVGLSGDVPDLGDSAPDIDHNIASFFCNEN